MNKKVDCHKDFFHDYALKNTPARDLVFHILEDTHPITLDRLFNLVSKKNKAKTISHSTVFRIVEQFLKVGIIEKLILETETTPLYQLKEKSHHHQLVCTQCKKIVLIDDCPLQSFENKMAKQHHFTLHHHQFTLYGLCSDCQQATH